MASGLSRRDPKFPALMQRFYCVVLVRQCFYALTAICIVRDGSFDFINFNIIIGRTNRLRRLRHDC